MSNVSFTPNRALIQELQAAPEFDEMRRKTAALLVPFVRAATPEHTGHAVRSVTVIEADGVIGVGSTDPFWHLIEWGSANNPPYAPLRNGVRAAGVRFDPSSI